MTRSVPLPSTSVVLFDWNGTVVLDAERARIALNDVLDAHGIEALSGQRFTEEFHLPMRDMFQRLGIARTVEAEAAWNRGMVQRVARMRTGESSLRMIRDAGVRLGVVSAAGHVSVATDMERLALGDVWDFVDAPAADKLAVLQVRRGTEDSAYYVGDTAYDMQCARAAGYVPVGVTDGYSSVDMLRAAGAVHIIESFAELVPLLNQERELEILVESAIR
ncbi:HAD family hydrolase (plasmid) [Coraliomargarita sp. W4R53]